MTEWDMFLYGAFKITAYVAVCWLGLRWIAAREQRVWPAAVGLGLLRAVMGLAFGVGIFMASLWIVSQRPVGDASPALAYLLVYVPTRWIEWSLIALFLARPARSMKGFWLGSGCNDRLWRCLGIGVSCAADVPVIMALGGIPIGRIMC